MLSEKQKKVFYYIHVALSKVARGLRHTRYFTDAERETVAMKLVLLDSITEPELASEIIRAWVACDYRKDESSEKLKLFLARTSDILTNKRL